MEWIDINSEEKPDILQSVLACLSNDMIVQVSYVGDNSFAIVIGLGIREIPENNPITHWQKLPKGPKRKKLIWQSSTLQQPDVWTDRSDEEYFKGKHLSRFSWRQVEK